jgi:3-oxoacyl-[acyl-carrier-protein] synthase-3
VRTTGHVVRVSGTGSFLPGDPVPNARIDAVLGEPKETPPAVRRMTAAIARRILAQSGVEARHFAVDPATGRLTHNVTGLAEEACRRALAAAGRDPKDVGLLVLGTPIPDRSTPPTSALLQERLGIEACAEMEIHSNCAGVGKVVQVAHDAIALGRYDVALVVYAQPSSAVLRGAWFNPARLTPHQAALRYILSDGAGAMVLERASPLTNGATRGEVLGTFVESVGGLRGPGMTMGGGIDDAVRFDSSRGAHEAGAHHLEQDFALVSRDAGRILLDGLVRMLATVGVDAASVRHAVLSMPTRELYDESLPRFLAAFPGLGDRAPFRGVRTGYCGGASPLIHLDQMARGGEIRPGETVAVHAVESSKWMTAGFVLRW